MLPTHTSIAHVANTYIYICTDFSDSGWLVLLDISG